MNELICCVALAAVFGPFGSRLKHSPINHPPRDALNYRGYDSGEKLVIRGWLRIDVRESGDVSGEWCLDRVGDPDNIGPQVGVGSLRGRLEGTRLSCNLNPGFADFNVLLHGSYDGTSYKGQWRYGTVKGPMSEGTFSAEHPVPAGDARDTPRG